jgi:hypothetical protein
MTRYTPTPPENFGGLAWHHVTSLVRALASRKGDHASDFIAAKLVYKCLGYIFCQE